MKKLKICAFTGTRADYPRIKSVLKLLNQNKKFELIIIVTGSHLVPILGNSYKEIEKDGFKIYKKIRIFENKIDDSLYGNSIAFAKCSFGVTKVLKKIKPDIALVTVDRVETLAIASTCALMNIPIAHVQGGEITGTIDESIRHAVTKLSHFHFVATSLSSKRVIQMGEEKKNVFKVGCPYTDILEKIKKNKFKSKFFLNLTKNNNRYIIFIIHSVTTNLEEVKNNFIEVIKAIKIISKNYHVFAFLPNTDPGCNYITKHLNNLSSFQILKNLESKYFLELMKYCSFMIGNSSSGIREAPTFKIPYICIGSRQKGRERSINVIDCKYDSTEIMKKVNIINNNKTFKNNMKKCKNIYGQGNAAKKIIKILTNLCLDKKILEKKFNIIK